MFKRICLLFLILCFQQVFAAETTIKITPAKVYSTCQKTPQEGDILEFVTVEDIGNIKKGTLVTGLLTERVENGFSGQVASLYVEQFKVNGKKINGILYQKGNPHEVYFQYYDWLCALPLKIFNPEGSYVRGGEAFLKPNKDIFTMYLED
ncbi:hypothetical protein IJ843_04145 [bacterium]|nr:hypothetical protein [bacterium]